MSVHHSLSLEQEGTRFFVQALTVVENTVVCYICNCRLLEEFEH